MKVFRGTSLASELLLTDTPTAMAVFYPTTPSPKDPNNVPSLALASGATIYVYRNLRPHSKFQVPKVDFPPLEKEAWLTFKATVAQSNGNAPSFPASNTVSPSTNTSSSDTQERKRSDSTSLSSSTTTTPTNTTTTTTSTERVATAVKQLYTTLSTLRDNVVAFALTYRSGDFLALTEEKEQIDYALAMISQPLDRLIPITCLGVLQRSSYDEKAASSLVVGTEHGKLLFLNPHATQPLFWVDLPSPPTSIVCKGLLDVDYRVYASCRDGRVYCARKDKPVIVSVVCTSHIVDMVISERNIFTATMDGMITAYSYRGTRDYSIQMPCNIICMTLLQVDKVQNIEALLISLSNGEVRLYNGKELVNTIPSVDGNVATAMKFGPYGRENASLLLGYRSGMLSVKMLHRHVKFTQGDTGTVLPPPEQSIPLPIPSKTSLFIQQTQREKDQAAEMHDAFQRSLCKLRLTTARTLVNVLTNGQGGTLSSSSSSGVKMDVGITGLGPSYQLNIEITNINPRPSLGLLLSISYQPTIYKVSPTSIKLPALIPSLNYKYNINIECIDPVAPSDHLRLSLTSLSSTLPILSANVKIPASHFIE